MWQTQSGARIFVPVGGLERLVPEVKRARHLWLATNGLFRGSLRGALLKLLGVLARRAIDRGEWQAGDGKNYRLFESHLLGRRYQLWTRSTGALVAIRNLVVEDEFEFEGEPGPSANNVHEQVIGYLNGLFSNANFDVRVDKDIGQGRPNGQWVTKTTSDRSTIPDALATKIRPDLQVTDKRTGRTFYVEVDSDPKNGEEHRRLIQQHYPGAPTILIGFDHKSGAPTFKTTVDSAGAPRNIKKLLADMKGQEWKVLDLFKAMNDARVARDAAILAPVKNTTHAAIDNRLRARQRRSAQLRRSRINRPPAISGAIRRTSRGGRHREAEFFTETIL